MQNSLPLVQLFLPLCGIGHHQLVEAIEIGIFIYKPVEDPRGCVALLLPFLLVPCQPAINKHGRKRCKDT